VDAMAELERKRPDGRGVGGPARKTVVTLKACAEWKTWLDKFAVHCLLGLADSMERSLLFFAQPIAALECRRSDEFSWMFNLAS
jgi:hypothetical protein